MVSIKVLGPGCANCHKVEEVARAAVEQLAVDASIEKVADAATFARYGLLFTPGLVIDETLVSGGRIPTVAEVTVWVGNALVAAGEASSVRQLTAG